MSSFHRRTIVTDPYPNVPNCRYVFDGKRRYIITDPFPNVANCSYSLEGKPSHRMPLRIQTKLTLSEMDVSKGPLACKRAIAVFLRHVFHFNVRVPLPTYGRTVKLSFKHAELEIDDVDLPSDPNDMVELLMHYPIWAKTLTTGSDVIVFVLTYCP